MVVALVELRRHRLLQQVVERAGLQVVAPVLVGHAVGRRYLPTVFAVVPLVPPAVADRQVQPAVERALHSGRAARLQRPQRVVEPDIAAPVQQPRHRHVVVGQEGDAVAHLGPVGEPHHLLDQRLAAVVGGVGLAGDDQLDRPVPRRAAAAPAAPDRAASASAACRSAPAGRTRWSAHSDRMPLQSNPIRPPTRRAPATIGAAGPGRPRPAAPAAASGSTTGDRRSTCCSRSQTPGSLNESDPASSRPSCNHCGAAQVRACTPLVIDPIGTSPASKPGHSSLNMARLTRPCSSETPLARCASRRPMCAMLNFVGSSSAPNARIRSVGTPGSSVDTPSRARRRNSAAPSPPGTGRYRRAPGCGW